MTIRVNWEKYRILCAAYVLTEWFPLRRWGALKVVGGGGGVHSPSDIHKEGVRHYQSP